MRPTLRTRYFRALIRLIAIMFGLVALILLLFNIVEWHEHPGEVAEEVTEFVVLLGLMILAIPLVLVAAWRIAGALLRPLQAVLSTAERIRAGNLEERIPVPDTGDELARLAGTINHAFDQYAVAMNRLARFSADASHQLRTPLAAIRTSADVGLQQERAPEDYRETLGEVLEQTEHLQHMVDQLLLMSRMDGALRDGLADVALGERLTAWVAEAAAMAADRGIAVEGSGLEVPLPRIKGQATLLQEVFRNLVANAMNAIPGEGTIRISLEQDADGWLVWRTEDSGPGIPDAERNRVFDAFYRGGGAATAGSGLGLAIVHDIVALHGGRVGIEASPDLGGAAVVIRLPAHRGTSA